MNNEGARGATAGNPGGEGPPDDGDEPRRPNGNGGGGGDFPRIPEWVFVPPQQQGIAVGLHEIPKDPNTVEVQSWKCANSWTNMNSTAGNNIS